MMSKEDYAALLEYRKDKKKGRLISHEDLKNELGLLIILFSLLFLHWR